MKNSQLILTFYVEVEYRAMAQICCEIVWIVGVLLDLQVLNFGLADLFCDNKTSIQVEANLIFHEWTKHIQIDCHLVCDYLSK